MNWNERIKLASEIGTALGGAAAFLGVVLAWRGFRAWRRQKRDERRSEAAVRAFELVTIAGDALRDLTQPNFIGLAGTKAQNIERADRLAAAFKIKWDAAEKQLEALDEAASICALLLDFQHELMVQGLKAERNSVRTWYALCAIHMGDGDFTKAEEGGNHAWGPEARKRIEATLESARDAFRPVAQYHANPLLSMILRAQRRRLWAWLRKQSAGPRSGPPQRTQASPSGE